MTTATLTHSIVETCDALKDYLLIGAEDLGVPFREDGMTRAVYYGYTELHSVYPAISLENASKIRGETMTRKWPVDITVDVMIHYGKIQDSQSNEREENLFAEAVEDYLNADPKLGGLFVFSSVDKSENMLVRRTMTRARRLVWGGISRQLF